jgi:spore coat polysaccharide biosynthesis protein SpsF
MIVIIVQARLGSTRLPGKVLKPIAGRPMLSYQLERLRRVSRAQRVVIAIPDNPADKPIADFCAHERVDCSFGPEHDVLARYAHAAEKFGASVVVRVTSDCPLIDPGLIDLAIDTLVQAPGGLDYVSNMLEPSWPYGMAVEVFTASALADANAQATDPAEREHVTPFIRWRPQLYRLKSLTMRPDLSEHRWTVDTPEDFELVTKIFEALYPRNPQFEMTDVLRLLEEHPTWSQINRHIQQKAVLPASEAKR